MACDAWLVFEDEAGFTITPPTTRTWSRRGHPPIVRVHRRSRRRLSVAALLCYKPGHPTRLTYRPHVDRRPDGRKSFARTDYRDLLQSAPRQLGGNLVLVRDNVNTHLAAGMRNHIADRDRLVAYQLPPYAPDLHPVEGVWSILRHTALAHRAFAEPHELITAVRRGPRLLQRRNDVLDGASVAPD
ncbi:transposase [Streptomyces violens]|uniref:transposase n=1 Tax=Streptomyces violens TaxID=66377 RepID=UPI000AEDA376